MVFLVFSCKTIANWFVKLLTLYAVGLFFDCIMDLPIYDALFEITVGLYCCPAVIFTIDAQ